MKHLMMTVAMIAASAAFATPSITIDRVQQRYPWNGLVDIDYTISGLGASDDPADYYAAFKVTAAGNTYVLSNFLEFAFCDLPVTNGSHRVTWDTAADGVNFRAKDAKFDLDLVYEPVVDTEASYLILDLSGGPSAETWPVKYVKGDFSSAQFNKLLYKSAKLVLKKVKAGSFWMGTGKSGNVESTGRHYVQLTQDFFIGVFPFTQGQYKTIQGNWYWYSSGFTRKFEDYPLSEMPWNYIMTGTFKDNGSGTTRPAVTVDLNARARFHGESLASAFTLPTESQWEYFARAGSSKAYPWGSDSADSLADYEWYSLNAGGSNHGVGLKLPNPWGFYDVLGNVAEWCLDYYDGTYPTGTEAEPDKDPTGPATGTNKILRGGYYSSGAGTCMPGSRSFSQPPTSDRSGATHYCWGFRLALTMPKTQE